jgi:hypothetical protein
VVRRRTSNPVRKLAKPVVFRLLVRFYVILRKHEETIILNQILVESSDMKFRPESVCRFWFLQVYILPFSRNLTWNLTILSNLGHTNQNNQSSQQEIVQHDQEPYVDYILKVLYEYTNTFYSFARLDWIQMMFAVLPIPCPCS